MKYWEKTNAAAVHNELNWPVPLTVRTQARIDFIADHADDLPVSSVDWRFGRPHGGPAERFPEPWG